MYTLVIRSEVSGWVIGSLSLLSMISLLHYPFAPVPLLETDDTGSKKFSLVYTDV